MTNITLFPFDWSRNWSRAGYCGICKKNVLSLKTAWGIQWVLGQPEQECKTCFKTTSKQKIIQTKKKKHSIRFHNLIPDEEL